MAFREPVEPSFMQGPLKTEKKNKSRSFDWYWFTHEDSCRHLFTHRGFVANQVVSVADENMWLSFWVVSAFPEACHQNQQSEQGHCPKTSEQHGVWFKKKRKEKKKRSASFRFHQIVKSDFDEKMGSRLYWRDARLRRWSLSVWSL